MDRVLVFDLDDTLYPECDYVRSGLRAAGEFVAKNFSVADFGEEAIRLFDSGVRGRIFQEVLLKQHLGHLCEELVPQLVDVYRNHRPVIALYPDAEKAIQEFRVEYRLAIITDGYLPPQKLKVEALGLEASCRPIIYTEEFGRNSWKPAPRAFLYLQSLCGVSGSQCTYVADNPAKDFIAPRLQGWRTIRVRRPSTEHGAREAAQGHQADAEIADLSQLAACLQA